MLTKEKLLNWAFIATNLLIVILLFTIGDHVVHGLEDKWSVPDYYFRNKIPFGFLWAVVGYYLARKSANPWLKALIVGAIVAITLQTRYFLEGYPRDFVFLFLLIHFAILYPLLVIMFFVLNKYNN